MSLARKLKRSNINKTTSKETSAALGVYAEQVKHISIQETLTLAVTIMAGILWNDFGKLQKREERLKNFAEIFSRRLETVDKAPDTAQLEAEAELYRQADWEIIRQKISQKKEISV